MIEIEIEIEMLKDIEKENELDRERDREREKERGESERYRERGRERKGMGSKYKDSINFFTNFVALKKKLFHFIVLYLTLGEMKFSGKTVEFGVT